MYGIVDFVTKLLPCWNLVVKEGRKCVTSLGSQCRASKQVIEQNKRLYLRGFSKTNEGSDASNEQKLQSQNLTLFYF